MNKVWIFNQYGMLPEHGPMARTYQFIKHLNQKGYNATAFVASHPHNTPLQLIEEHKSYKLSEECPYPWVFVKTCNYEDGKGLKMPRRIWSIIQYFFRLFSVTKKFEAPDCIIGSSAPPFTALAALLIARRYKCKGIVEVRDLWPESIVAYGVASKNNPIVKLMYRLEKWLYTHADAIIFTMEGGRDYIIEKGWDTEHGGSVDINKVHHINNGVDLEEFDYNKQHYTIDDPDLDNLDSFKVVYTGSIRKANDSLPSLFEAIKTLQERKIKDVKFFVYGKGDYEDYYLNYITENKLENVVMKGFVDKKYIPYILSRCNLNILNCKANTILRYGGSQNKLFEYFASGKPVLSGEDDQYSIISKYNCGISKHFNNADEIADAIIEMVDNPNQYSNIRDIAEKYDFKNLTDKLILIIQGEKQ